MAKPPRAAATENGAVRESALARREMLELLSGYWYSQCLYVLAELRIAELLAGGPLSSGNLAARCGADPDALFRLLRAVADAGIVRRLPDDRFESTPHLALLSRNHPGSLRSLACLGGSGFHWNAWGALLDSVRTGRCAFDTVHGERFFDFLRTAPDPAAAFQDAMGVDADADEALLDVLGFTGNAVVIDVGGGDDTFARRLVGKYPNCSVVVYDLFDPDPGSCDTPRPSGAGIEHWQGDFLDFVPPGGDVYLLKFVLHNWDDHRAARILGHCRDALHRSARLVVVEVPVSEHGESSMAHRHDLNMMVLTGGRERSLSEYRRLFESAGLRLEQWSRTQSGAAILVASR